MKTQPSRTGDLRRDCCGVKNCSCAAPRRLLIKRQFMVFITRQDRGTWAVSQESHQKPKLSGRAYKVVLSHQFGKPALEIPVSFDRLLADSEQPLPDCASPSLHDFREVC